MHEVATTKAQLLATAGEWEYVSCHCIVKLGTGGVVMSYECEACGNGTLRFIHTLEHVETEKTIWVGLDCARTLMEGSDIPLLAENETKRKERWRVVYRKPGRCITTVRDLENRGKL